MTEREQAEKWILSKCGEIGETVWHDLRNEDLPAGISLAVIRSAIQRMNQTGQIVGRIIEPNNAIRKMKLTRLK